MIIKEHRTSITIEFTLEEVKALITLIGNTSSAMRKDCGVSEEQDILLGKSIYDPLADYLNGILQYKIVI